MSPQSEQPGTPVQEQAAKTPPKRKAGLPVWRTGKPDAFLAAAVETARAAVEGITPAATIGAHLAAKSEGDRLVTHLFESRLPGYAGWQWYAVLTRNSRSKVVTVNELGLLPSEDSILAPEWVPWAERVRPEDEQQQEPDGDASGAVEAVEPAAVVGESAEEPAPAVEDNDEPRDGDEPQGDGRPQDGGGQPGA